MAIRLQLRRGTAAAWTAANPVLADGEVGLETDTGYQKSGDGVTAWNALAYRGTTAPVTHSAGSKATPVDADELPIVDSAASFGLKKLTWANLRAGIFSAWGAMVAAGANKATPVDADTFAVADSGASNATKQTTWSNIKATLKSYFDAIYSTAGVTISNKSANYTTVLADANTAIRHPSTDANARTFTIDSNANVAYPIGTTLTFINRTSQTVTIAIAADVMTFGGTTTAGSRTLAQNGIATAVKDDTTSWLITGTNLS
jgi:hypothetical protein